MTERLHDVNTENSQQLKGNRTMKKVAIVTGAASGIGFATASILASRGTRVVLTDLDPARGEAAANRIGANATFVKLDVSSEQDWAQVVDIAERLGDWSILVNNAGTPSRQPFEDSTVEEWTRVFGVHALGSFLGCRSAVRSMKDRGGSIVNVSSNSSMIGMDRLVIYTSSKAAVNGLTLAVAAHCRTHQLPIRCNTVIPGGTRSKMLRDTILAEAGIDIDDASDPRVPVMLADIADPQDVANVIVFVASDEARRMQGAEVIADGMQSRIFAVSPL